MKEVTCNQVFFLGGGVRKCDNARVGGRKIFVHLTTNSCGASLLCSPEKKNVSGYERGRGPGSQRDITIYTTLTG